MPNKPHRVIFTAEEVRAYLAGTKTQFRRVVKFPKSLWFDETGYPFSGDGYTDCRPVEAADIEKWIKCPFGRPGDPLYVAETYGYVSDFEPDDPPVDRPYLDAPELNIGEGYHRSVIYRADGEFPWCNEDGVPGTYWRPRTSMPRWASRLGPVVTEVRVQRVQDISVRDAVLGEGVDLGCSACDGDKLLTDTMAAAPHVQDDYIQQWNSRNPKPAHCWDANDWVWAVTIKPPTQMEDLFGTDITHGVDSVEHVRNMRD